MTGRNGGNGSTVPSELYASESAAAEGRTVDDPPEAGAHQRGELQSRLGALQSFVEHSSRTLEDAIDLAGATFREELDSFASVMARGAAAAFCAASALILLTVAAVLFVRELSDSWSLALVAPGIVYAAAAALMATRLRGGD